MKIISWNVNGIRAVHKKGFEESVKKMNPDILCLQEIKIHEKYPTLEGYEDYWNFADKKGYSGTAIFTKIKPLKVTYDLPEHKGEGRIIIAEFEKFYLIDSYSPNSGPELARLDYKQKFDKDLLKYMKNLEKTKPVILCGDLNIAHKEIDLKNPQSNKTTKTKPGNAGFTDEERSDMDKFIEEGFIDSFRYLYPDKVKYSWWSYRFNSRANNSGWRIDYFLVSKNLKLNDAFILNEIYGSDHCPVGIII